MNDFQYLVAIALIEQEGKRLMPIGGKSLKETTDTNDLPGSSAEAIALELLTRIMERSQEGPLSTVNGRKSLLLLQLPMIVMQDKIPILKAEWLQTGNTELFISNLKKNCMKVWSLSFKRYEGIQFNLLYKKEEKE